jgi:protein-disulfide isomerase
MSKTRILFFCLSLVMTILGGVGAASAAGSACEALDGDQRRLATEILQSQHAYDCCDRSLAECLKKKPVCRLVRRLSEEVCRRVAAGKSRAEIERALARRATSMIATGNSYRIDLEQSVPIGKPEAKVIVVAYVCARCPFCARLMGALDESVRSGKLTGKVKLFAKVFPVRKHEYSTEAGLGLLAAARLGKFWEYLLHLYREFDHFDPTRLADVAAAEGMDKKQFTDLMNDPKTRDRLVESKKEGVRNGVESTPTFFINGRKYVGELNFASLEDVLEEEYERVTGKEYE